MELFEHQQRILDKKPKRCLLAWSTGTGKSLAAIKLAESWQRDVLIIVPKALKAKWVRDVMNMLEERITVKVISKEEFRRDWNILPFYDTIILDEAHYFSGMKSQMSKNFLAYCRKHKPSNIYALTATPYMSTPWNIYRLAQILGYTWNYMSFFQKYFHHVKMGGRMVPVARGGMEESIAKEVHKIGDVVDINECFDVPEQTFETEYFMTTSAQKKAIKEVRLQAIMPVVKFTKLHQIEQGTLKGDEYNPSQTFEAEKNERILSLADENKKIAVVCRYTLQLDLLHSLLKEKGKTVFMIRGDVKDRDAVVQAVEAAEECVVLINAMCSEGYELPSVGVCVFASLSNQLKDYTQMVGRFLRANKLKKNVYIHLVNEYSTDDAMYQSIVIEKKSFDEAIYMRATMDGNAGKRLPNQVDGMAS